MKKHIRLTIDEKLYNRLAAQCTHHGEMTYLVREGIRMIVGYREHKKEINKQVTESGEVKYGTEPRTEPRTEQIQETLF